MCGIVGALAFPNASRAITAAYVDRMRETMAHRGPDSTGTWISSDARIGLGHRRLAIVDRSEAASQPMSNDDGSLWITFNGEIYNHAAIRRELDAIRHHCWKADHSDTEVVLHAFAEWGIDCIERFRGMFSFGLWDARKRELWLVRDRIGVKPLYYSVHHDRIVFASEIKALLADPEQRRAVDTEALFHYLSFLTTPGPQTMFQGIRKLAPGTWIRIREGGEMVEHRYWDVWASCESLPNASVAEINERLLASLRDSVKLRKMSDVPVGVFLSGGIDSSTNTALFAEGETAPVRTFSIGYAGEYASYRNEFAYARRMAAEVRAEHHERLLTADDLIDFLPQMVRLQDEPIADPVCVPVYYVSQLARQNGVTVCQVGEGADELFFGYPQWQTALRLQRLDDLPVPRLAKRLGLAALSIHGQAETFPYEWLRRGTDGVPIFWGGAEAFTETHKQRLLTPALRRQFAGRSSWEVIEPIRRHFEEAAWDPSHMNWMTYLDLQLRLPELLLMRVDKMSMGVGLEARVPFLDHRLVELVMSIPTRIKRGDGSLKYLLKRTVRGLIPDEIIDRPKQGFGVPVHEWFLGRLGAMIRTELDRFCRDTDLLDRGEVVRVLDSKNASQAWYLFNLALWWRTYIA